MIYLAPAIYRQLSVRTAVSLQAALTSAPAGEEIVWKPRFGDASVTRARSVLATLFLKDEPNADVFVMIDDDIIFYPQDLWRIVEGARRTKGIYSGVYVTHSEEPFLASRLLPGTPNPKFDGTEEPLEIEYAAAGFTAIHRDVLEAVRDGEYQDADGTHRMHFCQRGSEKSQFYPFFDTMTVEEAPGIFAWLSEDYAFCERARQLGYKVWLDPKIRLEHITSVGLTVDHMYKTNAGTAELRLKNTITLPVHGDPLLDNLPDDLAEFGDETLESIMAALPHGTEALAALWDTKPDSETEEEFYQRDDVGAAYSLDLAWWQLHGGGMPLSFGTHFKEGDKVLDFGAGIGTAALVAARAGAHAFVIETNGWLVDFMRWRAAKYGLNITVLSDDINVLGGKFDTIICWHVFEHVDKPNYLLTRLTNWLQLDGMLLSQSDFHIDDGHPMHHTYSGDWEKRIKREGYIEQSPNVYTFAIVPA